jgi:hypothetical protein
VIITAGGGGGGSGEGVGGGPGPEARIEALAQADLLAHVETLARVDVRLGEVLGALPAALRRPIESDAFRARANARFAELSFLAGTAAGTAGTVAAASIGLTVEELAPQAGALVAGKAWAPHADPADVARCLVRVFGSPSTSTAASSSSRSVGGGGGERSGGSNVVMRRAGFQRLLAATTITAFLERRAASSSPSSSPSAGRSQGTEVRALLAAMVAGHLPGHIPVDSGDASAGAMVAAAAGAGAKGAPGAPGMPGSSGSSGSGSGGGGLHPLVTGSEKRSADADAEALVAEWAASLAATVRAEAALGDTEGASSSGGGGDGSFGEGALMVAGFTEDAVEGSVEAATDRMDVPFHLGTSVTLTVGVAKKKGKEAGRQAGRQAGSASF